MRQQFREIVESCLEAESAFCTAICPFHLDTRDFMEKMRRGAYGAAYKVFRNAVGFPRIVSALCDQRCRAVCPRTRTDEALHMALLEKASIVYAGSTAPNRYALPGKGARIAVVGAGPGGLACALRLASRRYEVTVYEKTARIGGHLWDLLPPEMFLADIEEQFTYETVTRRLSTEIGSLDDLAGYDAVYVSTGTGGHDFGLEADPGGAFACSKPGVFMGGSLTGADSVGAIADGLYAVHAIERFLKTGAMNQPHERSETRMILDPTALYAMAPVKPADGAAYTAEEAAAEAVRCLRCACDTCVRRCDLMQHYKKFPKRICDEVAITIDPASLDGEETFAKRLMATCNQCGACGSGCPEHIDMGTFLLDSRRAMHRKGKLPWAFHDFWLKDMAHAMSETAALARKPGAGADAAGATLEGAAQAGVVQMSGQSAPTQASAGLPQTRGKDAGAASAAAASAAAASAGTASAAVANKAARATAAASAAVAYAGAASAAAASAAVANKAARATAAASAAVAYAEAASTAAASAGATSAAAASAAVPAFAFFPGCQLGASDPAYVLESYRYLLQVQPATPLWLACCGAPAVWSGDEALSDATFMALRAQWESLGKPTPVFACPTCKQMFARYLPEVGGVFLYDVMRAQSFVPRRDLGGGAYSVFDPCTSRAEPGLHETVRALATAAGAKLSPLDSEGSLARCCGWGGHVAIANPEYAQEVVQKRISQSDAPYITYCVNCRDSFASAGKEAVHLLDVLFDLHGGDRPAPGCNERRAHRAALRRQALLDFWGEDSGEDADRRARVSLEMDDTLRRKLADDLVLEEDILQAIGRCEAEGRTVSDEATGSLHGYAVTGRITSWVQYRKLSPECYRLINAYSHRMTIDLEGTWRGRKTKNDLQSV